MGLIHTAYRKRLSDVPVCGAHGFRILGIEGALVLIQHDAVFSEGFMAAAVKLPRKQHFAGTERVGGVHDDKVVGVLRMADKFNAVLKVKVHARVV
ncbi:hypothetical protein SDC9_207211 [bioreactor metagenome]|uniref:Uncharacterized protein n=1 Tax=bioreactor metagenome TaxID=1076179 RepID=A0A645J8N1_9ZZZZ